MKFQLNLIQRRKRLLQNYPIYKKNIGDKFIKILTYPILSTYLLNGVCEKIYDLNDDDYILCVGYDDDKGGDFQIGLTGSAKYNEDIYQSAIRETEEEMGLIFENVSHESQITDKKYISYIFTVRVEDCKLRNFTSYSKKKDDVKRKVTVLIHGDINKIMEVMNIIPL